MNTLYYIKKAKQTLMAVCATLMLIGFASCSGGEYYNAIPRESTALLRVDGRKIAEAKMSNKMEFMFTLIGIEGLTDTGIDFAKPVYFFESSDGNIGICAAMGSTSKLEEFIGKLVKASAATEISEKKDSKFTVIKGSWILGYNDDALLIMGPVVSADHAQQQKRMSRYLELDEDHGISSSELFEKLQNKDNQVALVAKASALPKQLTTPFLIGTPSGTSTDDVIIEADMSMNENTMVLNGGTSSLNTNIDQSIERAKSVFSKLSCDTETTDPEAVMSIYLNAKGTDFVNLLEANADLRQLLGNIDFKQKVSAINGNMLITLKNNQQADAPAESKYVVDVKPMTDNGKPSAEHLKIRVNLNGISSDLFSTLSPLLGDISELEYLMK